MYTVEDIGRIKLTKYEWDKVFDLFDKLGITYKDISEDQIGNLKLMYIERVNKVKRGEKLWYFLT